MVVEFFGGTRQLERARGFGRGLQRDRDVEPQGVGEAGRVLPLLLERLAQAQLEAADVAGGAEFVPLEGEPGGDALRELLAVAARRTDRVGEEAGGLGGAREVEVGDGRERHGLAALGFELVFGRPLGLPGREAAVDGLAQFQGEREGGARGHGLLGDVAHLADDVLQLAGVLAVADARRNRREQRPVGAVGIRPGLAEAGLRQLDFDRLGARQLEDGR